MKNLIPLARKLRRESTHQEKKLWGLLKAKRILNYKFRRQYPIEKYIVDFCCPKKCLIVEIDGGQHNEKDIIIKDKIF